MSAPVPLFVHYGLLGGACCSCVLNVDEASYLVVGTIHGICKAFSTSSQLPKLTVYDDPEHRSIISVGQVRSGYLFIHIRSYGVMLLRFYKGSQDVECKAEKLFTTKHYGFCRSISYSGRVYIPLYDEANNSVKIIDEHCNEQKLGIGFEDKKSRGMLMSLNVINGNCSGQPCGRLLICCFEEGTVALMNIEQGTMVHQIRAFEETIFACSVFANFVAIGSIKNIIKMYRVDESVMTYEKSVTFPPRAGGCGSLCFSPCGRFLASGYWDGSIRVHSVKSLKILAVVDFHKDTVDFLDWQHVIGRRLLFGCCKDGSLSIWNFFKD